MQTHIIKNGIVINTIVATVEEAQSAFPDSVCIEATSGGIGWTWDGSQLTAPVTPPAPVVVPSSVTMRQARLALLGAGILSQVDAAIAAMPGVDGEAARIEWEYAATVERNSALVAGLAGALDLTVQQLDELFVTAAGL